MLFTLTNFKITKTLIYYMLCPTDQKSQRARISNLTDSETQIIESYHLSQEV